LSPLESGFVLTAVITENLHLHYLNEAVDVTDSSKMQAQPFKREFDFLSLRPLLHNIFRSM